MAKPLRLADDVSGLITGTQGVQTYLMQQNRGNSFKELQQKGIKFIWTTNKDTNTFDFLFDAELYNPILKQLRKEVDKGYMTLE